ncbi:MAG: response regulator transcription factor [Phototrophicaceae bacterium]
MNNSIRVILVDDHAMVRQGLSTFLSLHDDIELVGMASSGTEVLDLIEAMQPDIILMDLIMPDMSGIDVIREINTHYNDKIVIALSSFSDKELVRSALEAGAKGYLLKDISGEELADAIRKAHLGQPALSDAATKSLMDSVTQGSKISPFELSGRERQVLSLIVEGKSNAEIAYAIGVKQSTVKTYVSRILAKLDVGSRVEAATIAIKYKLLN